MNDNNAVLIALLKCAFAIKNSYTSSVTCATLGDSFSSRRSHIKTLLYKNTCVSWRAYPKSLLLEEKEDRLGGG